MAKVKSTNGVENEHVGNLRSEPMLTSQVRGPLPDERRM
jgi:hypothetical protein